MKTTTRHNFPRWLEFRSAVDQAIQRPLLPTGLYMDYTEAFEEILAVFPHPPTATVSIRRPLNGEIRSELGALTKEITLSHVLAKSPLEPYFSVAHTLRDALGQSPHVPTVSAADEKWIAAIRIALAYQARRDPQRTSTGQMQAEHLTFAHAVGYFTDKGLDLRLFGDELIVKSNSSWPALAGTVSTPLLTMGDDLAMQYVEARLAPRFDATIQRIHLHPTTDIMGRKSTRSLPVGHLYRTALKSLGRRRDRATRIPKLDAIDTAATHFAALYQAEPFSTYDTMLAPYPHRVFDMLRRVVLYDELFTVPQCEPGPMESLIRGLFAGIQDPKVRSTVGWSLDDAIAMWKTLLFLAAPHTTSCFVDRSRLRRLLVQNVGQATSDALLNSFVLSTPNANYRGPTDANVADTRECALATASDDRYWIAPRPFMGPAFFARLVAQYARADKTVSAKMGIAFETHLVERLKQLGIQCRRGDILGAKGQKRGDLDLVLETPDVIGLFELKKKGLTRKTNSGHDLQLAIDLACGMVRGFNQLTRHELALLREGHLTFTDGTALELNGRRVMKCVISLADYGGLHEGAVVRNMLGAFSQIRLNPARVLNETQQEGLNSANEQLETLQGHCSEFASLLPSDRPTAIFDNFLFHNVFFVEHLLHSKQTSESLLQSLLRGHRIVTGSRDPFFDHLQFNAALG